MKSLYHRHLCEYTCLVISSKFTGAKFQQENGRKIPAPQDPCPESGQLIEPTLKTSLGIGQLIYHLSLQLLTAALDSLFWKLKLTFSDASIWGLHSQWKLIMENSSPVPIQFPLFTYKLQSGTEVVKHHHACFLWPVGSCCPHVIWLHKIACNSISEQKPGLLLTADSHFQVFV